MAKIKTNKPVNNNKKIKQKLAQMWKKRKTYSLVLGVQPLWKLLWRFLKNLDIYIYKAKCLAYSVMFWFWW